MPLVPKPQTLNPKSVPMPLVRRREEEGLGAAAGGDEETAGGEGQGDPQECKGDEPRPHVTAR